MSEIHRPYLQESVKDSINLMAEKNQTNENGELVDPNTGGVIEGKPDIGHRAGFENRGFIDFAKKSGMSQQELNRIVNNPGLYQLEDHNANIRHEFEEKDPNATALNTAAFCYFEDPSYQENIFVNPPENEDEDWTLTIVNKETGVESQIGAFSFDFDGIEDGTE